MLSRGALKVWKGVCPTRGGGVVESEERCGEENQLGYQKRYEKRIQEEGVVTLVLRNLADVGWLNSICRVYPWALQRLGRGELSHSY